MPPLAVILDANVLIADFHMAKAPFRTLLDAAREGRVRVFLPYVALLEVCSHFEGRLSEARLSLDQFEHTYHRLTRRALDMQPLVSQIGGEGPQYQEGLQQVFTDLGGILPYPTVEHGVLVERAIARRAPFGHGDAGYKDALIWESVLNFATDHPECRIAFVSNNTKDFANKDGQLQSALEAEVHDRLGGRARLEYFPSLDALVARWADPDREITDFVHSALEADQDFYAQVLEHVRASSWDLIGMPLVWPRPDSAPEDYIGPEAVTMKPPTAIRLVNARSLSDPSMVFTVEADIMLGITADMRREHYLARPAELRSDDVLGLETDQPIVSAYVETDARVHFDLQANKNTLEVAPEVGMAAVEFPGLAGG